ncbi:RhaT protein [Rodentibacter genomosp. 1]|uniref:RhaT protein n=1 Tax=Rodentibacter genomosp. 1 TaxID=1908264 RepID=A0A1V3J1T8_9PAST|nr:DMT family transporter [Rodentibacter genomosp. 1]OOF48997.1 RhaT protein [Rodentibacter genomosp. 1]
MLFHQYRGEWILFIATIAAALGWLFSKNAITELPAVAFVSLRFSAAALIFLPFAWKQLCGLNTQQWKQSMLVGFSFSLYLFCWVLGIKFTTELGKGAFLLSLAMLAAPLIAWGIYKQRPIIQFWFALPVAVIGMYFLASGGGDSSESVQLDTLFFLLTALWAAIQFVLNRHYAQFVPVLALTTIQLSMVGAFCGIYSFMVESIPTQIGSNTWIWLGLSILIGTNLRFFLQTLGQKLSDMGNGALIMILEPVWTMLLSVIFMAEVMSISKIIGCIFILMALVLYRLNINGIRQLINRYR